MNNVGGFISEGSGKRSKQIRNSGVNWYIPRCFIKKIFLVFGLIISFWL